MSDYETYMEEQESRLRELRSKADIVIHRGGITEDREERAMVRILIAELRDRIKLFEEIIEELRDAGSAWEDMKDSVEKAYLNAKESLRKSSGGLVK